MASNKRTKMGFTDSEKALLLWRQEQRKQETKNRHPHRQNHDDPYSSSSSLSSSPSRSQSPLPKSKVVSSSRSSQPKSSVIRDWRGLPIQGAHDHGQGIVLLDTNLDSNISNDKLVDDSEARISKKLMKKEHKKKTHEKKSKHKKDKSKKDKVARYVDEDRKRSARSTVRERSLSPFYIEQRRGRRSRSRSVDSFDSTDSLGRDLRTSEERQRKKKCRDRGSRLETEDGDIAHHKDRSCRRSSSPRRGLGYGSGAARRSRSRSRSLSPSSLAKLPAPRDPARREHDDRSRDLSRYRTSKTMYKDTSHHHYSKSALSGGGGGGAYDGYSDRRSRRSASPSSDMKWNHEGFIANLRDPSPERFIPKDYVPPKPEWKSRAGGVYIATATTSAD